MAAAPAPAAISNEDLAKLAQNPVARMISLPFQNNTSRELGNRNWGLGPSFVVLHVAHDSLWVYGVLMKNIWSLGHDRQGGYYKNGLIQGFLNYNFKGGLYLTSSPILTVDWMAASGQRWVLPVGGGIGKIFHLGKQPVNAQVSAYYNVVTPDNGADWQIRAQVQLLFPE
ncbi:hypothetical protein [Candidatus Thiodictyon syntrophicum]|uniref:hypothetical protein n=1 Tax=Candidatus Thiodictyon syntrophicum TaxID=1166950 RepID=UPI003AABF2BE